MTQFGACRAATTAESVHSYCWWIQGLARLGGCLWASWRCWWHKPLLQMLVSWELAGFMIVQAIHHLAFSMYWNTGVHGQRDPWSHSSYLRFHSSVATVTDSSDSFGSELVECCRCSASCHSALLKDDTCCIQHGMRSCGYCTVGKSSHLLFRGPF